MKSKFTEYDGNMLVKDSEAEGFVFYDVREAPFEVYGFYDCKNQEIFKRLPDEIAANTNAGVQRCHLEASGGRVRFSTNSSAVAIRAEFELVGSNSRTPQLGIAGFDLYTDTDAESRCFQVFVPPYDVTDGYESVIDFGGGKSRSLTINFPYHTSVKNLYIGLKKGAYLSVGMKYRNESPVVFYGSSIVHGSCASRPGMTYPNILSRRLNLNYTNLGFGGSAGGEKAIAEYMAGLDMCMFISDYDYNARDVQTLKDTHKRLYETIREKQPDLPYLMISKPDFCYRTEDAAKRREVIFNTYMYALGAGDENVYYIDGSSMFRCRDWDNYFVDTIHPNDAGFIKMADAIEPVIVTALSKIMR